MHYFLFLSLSLSPPFLPSFPSLPSLPPSFPPSLLPSLPPSPPSLLPPPFPPSLPLSFLSSFLVPPPPLLPNSSSDVQLLQDINALWIRGHKGNIPSLLEMPPRELSLTLLRQQISARIVDDSRLPSSSLSNSASFAKGEEASPLPPSVGEVLARGCVRRAWSHVVGNGRSRSVGTGLNELHRLQGKQWWVWLCVVYMYVYNTLYMYKTCIMITVHVACLYMYMYITTAVFGGVF